ncbi:MULTISPECIES: LLM class flavin-dependent oxidoreductase [unclassified Variovorax]|uniref:LLM class flavin-dependent oxidoreductase n=1 Tax=unclassified Variovorax TaxID=663243 RepID=UPI0008CEED75|nr:MULTISPECIES: LLM class flavin-dependent oxidoreductase [unclassified Variovorax]SEJ74966.1 Flavin-dependent oxidoreductase, luciferase family (includes alkanesulfonate monooxygenase SsuD and methylene tetrahydromethanopterin reductase) [Variovorax sp. OK202]SFC87517.1 Flavin-dependent oxidoreductase, luciferase family (includes alkanesulfonate monooxygenase SsuD and methylene tetrahydromethanopterin reductase) [Variovorax sp. OK212]
MSIRRLAFLTPGNYAEEDPLAGLEAALKLFAFGEKLGFDGAWVRQRHLERGVSSAATFLAAATQRTRRIELGAAVIQMGYENPFRLAEDLATVDVLSRGRLQVGLSAGAPLHGALLGNRFHDAAPHTVDYTHKRVGRLKANLEDTLLGDAQTFVESAGGRVRARVQPHAPGLVERLWYGGGSLRSAEWAGRNGFNLLLGNVLSGETTDDFLNAQLGLVERYRLSETDVRRGRIALGRVIVPLDSADAATRKRYRAFAAGRVERTLAPQGERRTLFANDLVGTSDEILERLRQDPVLPQVEELRVELPYNFSTDEYEQILTDLAGRIAPELGWRAN